jgi:hypothetical protein
MFLVIKSLRPFQGIYGKAFGTAAHILERSRLTAVIHLQLQTGRSVAFATKQKRVQSALGREMCPQSQTRSGLDLVRGISPTTLSGTRRRPKIISAPPKRFSAIELTEAHIAAVGLQLIGRPFDERTLFSAAQVIEHAAGRFQPVPWW